MITLIIAWVGLSVAVGILAERYQRSAGWFLTALVVSPLIAGAWLLAIGPQQKRGRAYRLEDGRIVDSKF
jgi:hypothetical protein